jgi:hypothetical protein
MVSFPDVGVPDHPAADARVIAETVPNPQSLEIAGAGAHSAARMVKTPQRM